MDFFERQDEARRHTKLLVFYFVVAVALIIAGVYLAVALIFAGRGAHSWWHPQLFLGVSTVTLLVVMGGSLTKISQLSAGGSAVAVLLGGRLLHPATRAPDERKLLNVVEEMALASGVPVPPVYLLDDEPGINAFAAGHTTRDAIIGVTRGAVKQLTRDELQGVVAHEFSHILNGDMRLNLRLMGTLFGILCIATVGRILLRVRSRGRDRNPLPLLGLALLVIGGIGVFFGRLIQSAVSRQREFLADASSVQFTRNPAGLSGALQKIGGSVYGSKLESNHASDACHMFFGNGLGDALLSAFATHPPLAERIHAIDPQWDGKFIPSKISETEMDGLLSPPKPNPPRLPPLLPVPPVITGAALASQPIRAHTVLPNLGKPTPLHLRYAQELRASFPDRVQAAAHQARSAASLIYAMLLSEDETTRPNQLREISRRTTPAIADEVAALLPDAATIGARARLPLVELAMPALRQLQPGEFAQFNATLTWLIESDGQVDLFEFMLQKIISRHLEPQFGQTRRPVVQYYTMTPLLPDAILLLSALAQVGSSDPAQIERAFQQGLPHLRSAEPAAALLPRGECGLEKLDAALNRIALAVPQIKKNVLNACIHVVGMDGVIMENEAELLRAIADTLDCPIPPFVAAD